MQIFLHFFDGIIVVKLHFFDGIILYQIKKLKSIFNNHSNFSTFFLFLFLVSDGLTIFCKSHHFYQCKNKHCTILYADIILEMRWNFFGLLLFWVLAQFLLVWCMESPNQEQLLIKILYIVHDKNLQAI